MHMLNEINLEYEAIGESDGRLTERGGGIGLLWHKSLAASPISGTNSDRICGIICIRR